MHPQQSTEYNERATNVPDASQSVELGAYHDVAPVLPVATNNEIFQAPHQTSNMEKFTLDDVLNREYPIDNLSWTSASAYNTQLTSYGFPQILFNQTFINNKINDFYYFRGGIRLTFRVTTQQFAYGRLCVCYIPQPYKLRDAPYTNVQLMTGFPHILLSASSGDTVEFTMPFISDKRFIDLQNYVNNEMGRVYVSVLNPLTDINGNSITAQVFVTASFVDAEMYLPVTQQSMKKVHKEADAKSKAGTISSTLNAAADIAGTLSAVPFVSPYANIFSLAAKPAASMFKRLGLSKPVTTAITDIVKINPHADVNYGSGLATTTKFSVSPENRITTDPVVGGVSADEMSIKYIAGMPMLDSVTTITPTTGATVIDNIDNAGVTYFSRITQLFRFWSASIKYSAYIEASQFHSVRLVFYLNNAFVSTHWENCYHKVVDVQGPTTVQFTIPYLFNELMTPTSTSAPQFQLFVKVLAWNQPDMAKSCPVFINLYKAADADIQVGAYLETGLIVQSCPRTDFSQPFEPLCAGMSGYSTEGLIMGEKVEDLRSLIHKYHAYTTPAQMSALGYPAAGAGITLCSTSAWYPRPLFTAGVKQYMGIEMLMQFFCFYRGSIRLKYLPKDPTTVEAGTLSNLFGLPPLQAYAISCPSNPHIEFEVPYYDSPLYKGTSDVTQQTPYANLSANATSYYIFKAGGDDFSGVFLRPLPDLASFGTPFSGTAGDGLITFLN